MQELMGEVQRVADAILARIVRGAYPAGLRLPAEVDLARELDCGRSTVREALRSLGGLGVVRSRRGSGVLVLDYRREGTPALLPMFLREAAFAHPPAVLARELLRLRAEVAASAVRLAARYASPESLGEARARLAAAPALEADPLRHASNELELYRALVAASQIWPAVWLVNSFLGPLREVHRLLLPALRPVRPEFQRTMERLLDLVAQHDEQAAVALVRAWFDRADAELESVLEHAVGLVRAEPTPRPGTAPTRK